MSREPTSQEKVSASAGVNIDRAKIGAIYDQEAPRFKTLLDEVIFTLEAKLADIKLHTIERRVKSLESILKKCERESCTEPFEEFSDIAGARIVCLFKDDLEIVGRHISECFNVAEVDDKRASTEAPLGYLSVHYICTMPERYKGPRYDKTAKLRFEIQVRTLCMHCWAAVSHHLDYKGEWDVPKELRMALNALGGLFYVADNEFQRFYVARQNARQRTEADVQRIERDEEINFDTVTTYLRMRFPKRKRTSAESQSDFVRQLKAAGYTTLGDVDRDILRGMRAMEQFEKTPPSVGGKSRYPFMM